MQRDLGQKDSLHFSPALCYLISSSDRLNVLVDKGKAVDILQISSRAFNTVPHNSVISKPEKCGLDVITIRPAEVIGKLLF